MSTHEREITAPVLLCHEGTGTLNEAAQGFSRRPLQHANLSGRFGRNKRWEYWAVLAGDRVIALTYANLDFLGLVDVWWVDLATGKNGGRSFAKPFPRDMRIPELSGGAPVRFTSRDLFLEMATEPNGGTRLRALWRELGGAKGSLDVVVDLPEGHESLNVVIPWSDETFQFTSKHQGRPAHGELVLDGVTHVLGGEVPAYGVLDVGRGRWPHRTRWNWGGGAGTCRDGKTVVGLQIGGKWTEGTGFTENGFFVDGKLTKIGAELEWNYDFDHPLRPWRVRAPDGSLDVTLEPTFDRHTRVDLGVLGSHVHQVFGMYRGFVVTDAGRRLEFERMRGFAEECRSRW